MTARHFLEHCHYGPSYETEAPIAKINDALAYLDRMEEITRELDAGSEESPLQPTG